MISGTIGKAISYLVLHIRLIDLTLSPVGTQKCIYCTKWVCV